MSSNNNNNNTDETKRPVVVEDKPQLRSVSMLSAPPPIPLRHAAMPPPLKFAGTTPKLSIASVEAKTSPVESGPRWRVTTPLVKPSYHEFERTHVTIVDVPSEEISARIDNCLRKASIAASFNNNEAVARANTCDCLKFAVRLWQAKEGVTVEVQRTKGCSFLFQQTFKRIVHAAKTGSELPPAKSLPAFRPVPPIPQPEWEKSTVDGVSLAKESLHQQNKVDAHQLAIESLVELSKTTNCKAFCSKLVFAEDSMIIETLVSLIVHNKITPGSQHVPNNDGTMRRNAISTLANCLEESSSDLADILARFPSLTSPEVLYALIHDVGSASSKPHCAAAACRCLSLLSCDENSRSLLQQVRPSISQATECHHEVLRAESTKLLQAL